MRAPRERKGEDNAQMPVLDQGQGNAAEVYTAVGRPRRGPKTLVADLGGRHKRRSASEHPRHAPRRAPSEGQPGKRLERLGHQHRVGRRDGRSQRQPEKHRKWQNEEWQREADRKDGEKEFCLAQCQGRPRVKRQSHHDGPGTGYHRGNWRGGAGDDP